MAFFNFYCIFGIFGTRGVQRTKKRRKTCSEVRFFALKFGTMSSTFRLSRVVSAGYTMSGHTTCTTKLESGSPDDEGFGMDGDILNLIDSESSYSLQLLTINDQIEALH